MLLAEVYCEILDQTRLKLLKTDSTRVFGLRNACACRIVITEKEGAIMAQVTDLLCVECFEVVKRTSIPFFLPIDQAKSANVVSRGLATSADFDATRRAQLLSV